MDSDRGLALLSRPGSSLVFLLVDAGRVTDCTPWARHHLAGSATTQVGRWADREGYTLSWLPLEQLPKRIDWATAQSRTVRRWVTGEGHHGAQLLFEALPGGGWCVKDSREPHGWAYTPALDAWADCRRRIGPGWRRVPAGYDELARPSPELDLPDGCGPDWPISYDRGPTLPPLGGR